MAVRAAALITASAVVLALSPVVGARIVVPRSIAGVELGMTKAQVRARLGKPRRIEMSPPEPGAYTEFFYPAATVTFEDGRTVTGVRTTSPRERTATGIGVGSTLAAVVAKIRGTECLLDQNGRPFCVAGERRAGGRIIIFHFRRGRVAAVELWRM